MHRTTLSQPPGFDALSKAQQIDYLQALWDHVRQTPETLPAREDHLRVAAERLVRVQSGEDTVRSAFEILDELSSR